MNTVHVGDVSITRVLEWSGPVATVDVVLPASDAGTWQSNRSWLSPDFWDPRDDSYQVNLQTWLVRSAGSTILVDTGAGRLRSRPGLPAFGQLDTDLPARLAEAGVRPTDVDLVVNTHLHLDHVGWNTTAVDGGWEPTFPNATYLLPRADVDAWRPGSATVREDAGINTNVFDDSVRPVLDSGQAVLWAQDHVIDADIRLEAAPGHTPGHSVLKVRSRGESAVLVGDVLHSPIQILKPEWNSCFCEDPAMARTTRGRLLGWAADNSALVLPSHFGGHGACEVARRGGGFALTGWGDLDVAPVHSPGDS